jgi:sugar/nucleoside kinase (ribokinase family)
VNLLPEMPGAGRCSKLRISSHFMSCGGQVATAMAACAALGLRSRFLGPLGTDANAARLREELARRGVDVSFVIVHEAANQFAMLLVDERSGERIVLWNRDPRLSVRPAELSPEAFAGARVLHVDDVDEEGAIAAARIAGRLGLIVTSDLDRVTERTADLVASVSIPLFAESVPPALTGESDPERALRKLRRTHPGLLCVTLGERGALALDGDRIVYAPGFRVAAVDTTGAGDIFRAGFIYALLDGRPTDDVLRFANAAAAASCTKLGAMAGVPTLDEVRRILDGE